MLLDKPMRCVEADCPLARCKHCDHSYLDHPEGKRCSQAECNCSNFEAKGKGFVLDSGDFAKAKYLLILEAPGKDEVQFPLVPVSGRRFFETQEECDAEIERRRAAFPDIEERFLKMGSPVVGSTGAALDMWIMPQVGMVRSECALANTLRCLPETRNGVAYPVGDDRKGAEKVCRMWDRLPEYFKGDGNDCMLISFHPASLMREITPLPLVLKDFEKMRDFTAQGCWCAMLLGGKAAKAFLRYGDNVSKWRGSYELLKQDYLTTYRDKFECVAKSRKKIDAPALDDVFGLAEIKAKPFRRKKKNVG